MRPGRKEGRKKLELRQDSSYNCAEFLIISELKSAKEEFFNALFITKMPWKEANMDAYVSLSFLCSIMWSNNQYIAIMNTWCLHVVSITTLIVIN